MRFWEPRHIRGAPRLGIVVATYRQGPKLDCLLASLAAQTYRHQYAVVVHDGPWADRPALPVPGELAHTPARANQFGHNCREAGRLLLAAAKPDYVMFTNGDNYYAPVFAEEAVWAAQSAQADLVYCNMIHSHKKWQPLKTELKRGRIDLGCWVCRADWVLAAPFAGREFAADWFYLEKLLARRPRVAKVDGYYMVHN